MKKYFIKFHNVSKYKKVFHVEEKLLNKRFRVSELVDTAIHTATQQSATLTHIKCHIKLISHLASERIETESSVSVCVSN